MGEVNNSTALLVQIKPLLHYFIRDQDHRI